MAHRKAERNKKIVEWYDDPKKKLTFRAIANIFQIAESTTREIYYREKGRLAKEQN